MDHRVRHRGGEEGMPSSFASRALRRPGPPCQLVIRTLTHTPQGFALVTNHQVITIPSKLSSLPCFDVLACEKALSLLSRFILPAQTCVMTIWTIDIHNDVSTCRVFPK